MAHGKLEREVFMKDIRGLTTGIVDKVRRFRGETIEGEYATLEVPCPKCGRGPVREEYRSFRCHACDWLLWKAMASRQFTPEEVTTLLTHGRVGPLHGFRSKVGRAFDAIVVLDENKKPQFIFPERQPKQPDILDTSKQEAIGLCPVCQKGQVYVLQNSYACEHSMSEPKSCNFRMGKMILQREIPIEQAKKIIGTGMTDFLPNFISKKNKPFTARLKLEDGKVVFEFEPRKPKAKTKAKTKAEP
jgi:DNA topoisomerase-3